MSSHPKLDDLAAYVEANSAQVLDRWRQAVKSDPRLPTTSSLSHSWFFDHIPDILEDYIQRLRADSDAQIEKSEADAKEDAVAHGLHRWQQGFHLRELTREWLHLQVAVQDVLDAYESATLVPNRLRLQSARRLLTHLCGEGISESTAEYLERREAEAAGQVRDLERVLDEWKDGERHRNALWREAAHDLRGSMGILRNATFALGQPGIAEEDQGEVITILNQGVHSMQSMLEDVLSLARLQAGQEQRRLSRIDVAPLLQELCTSLTDRAAAKKLALKAEGPASFVVDSDPVKLHRIAQNLLLNSLYYTHEGGVTVSWDHCDPANSARWVLRVNDTGPGITESTSSEAPIRAALERATEENPSADSAAPMTSQDSGPNPNRRPSHQLPNPSSGEGIGLAIVKRLSELLDATLEVESRPGQGTSIRVILPRQYEVASDQVPD